MPLMAVLCAVGLAGCAGLTTGIDPTGRAILAGPSAGGAPSFHDAPGWPAAWDGMELLLYPQEAVASVGTEVVLLVGVRGWDRYLVTNEKIEWTIAEGSVGHFVDLGWGSPFDYLVGDFTFPRIIDGTRAVGSTSRKYLRLTRGNEDPRDDVEVLRGQTWISVTSPEEGTTYVTAFSPDVYRWDRHKQTAAIHWVDAQWQFPAPAINPAGTSHTLTTTVVKQSNRAPCVGWIVRYQILGGPPAAWRETGGQAVEVLTDGSGQASAEIYQERAEPGTNLIQIQVIRPGQAGGGNGKRLVVGTGSTTKTWSAPGLAVGLSGPAVAAVGSILTYRMNVSNPGDLPAEGVVLTDTIPADAEYVASRPAGEVAGGTVRWPLGAFSPGQTRSVEVDIRARGAGRFEHCVEATGAGGLEARDCVTTEVVAPEVGVEVLGPDRATVGEEVTFEIVITNRGAVPASDLLIKDRFEAGLEHAELASPIERELGETLGPGQSRSIGVVFRVTRAGRLCHTVQLLREGQILASAEGCVMASEPAPPAPPAAAEGPAPPPTLPGLGPTPPSGPLPTLPSGQLQVTVEVSGPEARTVGQTAEFHIQVTNTGRDALSNLKVLSQCDPGLEPSMASRGFQFEGDTMFWVIDSLQPGASRQFTVQARCVAPSPRACHLARVLSDQTVLAQQEVCLEILAAPAMTQPALSLKIFDQDDPVPVGESVTYLVEVSNGGEQADEQVTVVVTLPPELSLDRLGTSGPPVRPGYQPEGQTIRFQPVERIGPGETLTYRVRVRTRQSGEAVTVRAQLTSRALQQPIVAEEETFVSEPLAMPRE